jgi:hypothetical protein
MYASTDLEKSVAREGFVRNGGRAAAAALTWLLWVMAIGLWFAEMSAVGFSKPEHDDGDPVSAAAYNHQQNMEWAYLVFWMVVIPLVAAVIGGAIAERGGRRPGRRARAAAIGALVSLLAIGGFSLVRGVATARFTF